MNIAILGYGVEGESVYKYYRAKYPDAIITAYDNNAQPKNPLPAFLRNKNIISKGPSSFDNKCVIRQTASDSNTK